MNLLVLTYHYFHRDQPSGIKPEDFSFSVGLDDFENHASELASSGYKLIDAENIENQNEFEDESDRQILITIDDGHRSVEDAAETIMKYRLKPVLNIISGLVGKENYLTWSALRNLALQGFSIQSHSVNHANLTRLNWMELTKELELSKKAIEDNIGLPVTMLAAPMGRVNQRVAAAAREVGYKIVMTSFTGINTAAGDLEYMKRFQVKRCRKELELHDYYRASSGVRVMGRIKNMAKKVRDRLF